MFQQSHGLQGMVEVLSPPQSFLTLLTQVIARFPERVALAGEALGFSEQIKAWTYAELNRHALIIETTLCKQQVGPGAVVAIHTESRALAIAAIIAVLRRGAAYLPLDPVYPKERLLYMVSHAATALVITDNNDLVAPQVPVLDLRNLQWDQPLAHQAPVTISPADNAYIIYTSGSTGRPKGVAMNHGTLDNLIDWQNQRYADGQTLRTLQFSSLSFDVSFQEIFATFTQGGTLYLLNPQTKQDFRALLTFIDSQQIERIFLPYIALLQLLQWANRLQLYPQALREVITAGEQLVISEEVRKAFNAMPLASLANQYGPSESHVVTEYLLPEDKASWVAIPPIGRPIQTAQILLLDEQQQPVAEGEVGELYIAGPVLANGYLNNPEETTKRFVSLLLDGKNQRAYRTGDLAARDGEGDIVYKGRIDSQVKISGYRVELSEVEARLLDTPWVEEAAVAVQEVRGNKSLVAFITLKDATQKNAQAFALKQLQTQLSQDLPHYMVPAELVVLQALAKTPTGKIDRKTMLATLAEASAGVSSSATPQVDPSQAILALIRRELNLPSIGLTDNLVNQGMDSLGANRIAAALYDDLGLSIPAYALFQYRSVKRFIEYATRQPNATAAAGPSADKAGLEAPVAIIGAALRVPGANTLDEFWQNLADGRESVHFFAPTDTVVNARGLITEPLGFDEKFFDITPMEARFIDPQQRLLLELAWQALENAGVVPGEFPGRIGIFCGTGNNTYYLNQVLKNPEQLEDYGAFQAMLASEKDYCATRIAYKLNLVGPALSIHSACSTSLVAVATAVEAIRSGQCDLAIAGGAALTFPQQQPYEYQEGSIYSKDGHTRTFDAGANGTVFSDGAALVVLKRADFAERDGDAIVANIAGVALNNDGGDKGSFSAPSIEGQKQVILAALKNASVSARDIGYVEAHGTATPMGDPIEVAALQSAFASHTQDNQFCRLGSVKSNFGHLTAAAGVVGLLKSALAINRELIPPTLNFQQPNPALTIEHTAFVIADTPVAWQQPASQRLAGVSSFGIGGTNAHVIVRGVDTGFTGHSDATPHWLPLCLSAHSGDALGALIKNYQAYLTLHPDTNGAALAAYWLQHRAAFNYRASVGLDPSKTGAGLVAGIKAASEPVPPIDNIVFAFPGQGAQVAAMGKTLYESQASFRAAFDRCCELLQHNHQFDLKTLVFNQLEALGQTQNTQIALFAIGYSLAQTLIDLGVQPQGAIGHSIGELVAAAVAGVWDLPTALRVVLTRGRLMQAQPAGAMIAVREPAAAIMALLPGEVVVAAQNTPESCTLAGTFDAIDELCRVFDARDIKFKRLDTSHAFHSPAMDAAKQAFATELADIACQAPKIPFISCVSGTWITPQQATSIAYWADQLRQPVSFYQGIQCLAERPNLLIIECGPQRTVSGMVLQTLGTKDDIHLVPVLMAAGQEKGELKGFSQSLGQLWQLGLTIAWPQTTLDKRAFSRLPPYPFQHQLHVIEAAPAVSAPSVTATDSPPSTPISTSQSALRLMTDSLIAQLEGIFSDISGMDLANADRKASFFELGLDSLLLTQSTIKLKKAFKVNVTFRQLLNDLNHFDALASFLVAQGAVGPVPEVATPSTPVVAAATPALATATQPAMAIANHGAALQSLSANFAGNTNTDGSLLTLLQQQLQLLQGQLQLLSGQGAVGVLPVQAPSPTPAAKATPATSRPGESKSGVKPFGAGTRINAKRSNDLTPTQKTNLDALSARYNEKFKSSKKFAQDNRPHLADPRVVSGFRNPLKEIIYPIVVARSEGAYLWDMDGFRLVDITCGFGSNFFGNSAPFIKQAVAKQLDIGYEIGPQHPLIADASRLFCEVTGNDRAAFCNTGSEAVLCAVRLARTVTAKEKIVLFENDYHGVNDEVIVTRGSNGLSAAAAAGIPDAAVENVIVLDYGDPKSLDYIREHADDIAALLIEPVQSRYPELQPKDFLLKARELCTEHHIAFIFDEVITGFRIHQRGAQGYYGIQADICTYGKIVGGGLPIGVVGGKREFMDALDGGQWQYGDNSAPEVGVTYFAGTFVRHPLVLAAAVAVLNKLKAEPELQTWLNARADKMVGEVNAYAKSRGAPVFWANCGSMCKIKIPQDIAYEELIYVLLREKGVHVWDARPTFITTAHSDEDIAFIVQAFKAAIDDMLAYEFFPKVEAETKANGAAPTNGQNKPAAPNKLAPPVPGAKLGRDEGGKAVWYVPSSQDPSQFVKWQG